MKVFNFNPDDFSLLYSRQGYVHIKNGIKPEFLAYLKTFTEDAMNDRAEKSLDDWRFKNKKMQFMFEFFEKTNVQVDVKNHVATIAGFENENITLCERHIKIYDNNAPAFPPAHKDRLASEVAVGIPLDVADDSYIVLYPDVHCDVNPFSTTKLHRSSLDDEALPELILKDVEPVKVYVNPGDVVMFKGSSIYHERINAANSTLLYLKFNSLQLDPLSEDALTSTLRENSKKKLVEINEAELLGCKVMVSPQLEKISRHYMRLNWQEVIQVYLWGRKEITINELELRLITSITNSKSIKDILNNLDGLEKKSAINSLIRLIEKEAIHLL